MSFRVVLQWTVVKREKLCQFKSFTGRLLVEQTNFAVQHSMPCHQTLDKAIQENLFCELYCSASSFRNQCWPASEKVLTSFKRKNLHCLVVSCSTLSKLSAENKTLKNGTSVDLFSCSICWSKSTPCFSTNVKIFRGGVHQFQQNRHDCYESENSSNSKYL